MWIEQTKGFRKHDVGGHDQAWLDVYLSFIMLIYWIKLSIDQSMYWALYDCKRLEYIFEMSFFSHLQSEHWWRGNNLRFSMKKPFVKNKVLQDLKTKF
jgi:hypothetical protein